MSTDKITVIIPVYNVEHYLDRCVNSVLQQSYSETEILLIDDGSTDSSGIICDRLAETDPRIRVIHKENSGVSEARNTGLDFATGDFIAFVDSDDYLDVDTLKKLYAALKENDAEMSMCDFLYVDDNGVPVVGKQQGLPITDEVLSGFEILTRMHTVRRGKRFVLVWGKLYKRSLFSDIRFPKGKLGEDGWVAHEIFGKCSTIACISDIGYYYVQNPNSLMHNRNCMSYLSETEARFEQINYFRDHGMFRCAGHAYWEAAIKLQHAFARSRDGSLDLPSVLTDVLRTFRRYFWCHKYCTPKEQIQLAIIYINPNLYHFLFQNSIRYGIKAAYKSFFSKHTTT